MHHPAGYLGELMFSCSCDAVRLDNSTSLGSGKFRDPASTVMHQVNNDTDSLFRSSGYFNGGFLRLASKLVPFSNEEAALWFDTAVLVFTGNPSVTSNAAIIPAISSDKLLKEE